MNPDSLTDFQGELTDVRDRLATRPSSHLGGSSLVVRTKSLGSYPSAASRFYACEPVAILGPEVEGSAGVAHPAGTTLYAYNLGPSSPTQGTVVLVTFVNHRWVFRYDG